MPLRLPSKKEHVKNMQSQEFASGNAGRKQCPYLNIACVRLWKQAITAALATPFATRCATDICAA